MKRDYYEILGVGKNATESELKSAYRKLAMKWHPDRNPGDKQAEDRFKEAAEAYGVLSDNERRAAYDRYGHGGVSANAAAGGSGFRSGFEGFPFGDIFEDFFGNTARGQSRPQRGEDVQTKVRMTLEDAFAGKQVKVAYQRPEVCTTCQGDGARPGTHPAVCPTCKGLGEIRIQQGFFAMSTTCVRCGGEGQVITHPCGTCHGEGMVHSHKEITVAVPAGVETGNVLRMTGAGGTIPGGRSGDLHVVIEVERHSVFTRKGKDLVCRLPLSFAQAALGETLALATPEGEVKVNFPEGTQAGDVIRLKGRGMPEIGRAGRGDILVEAQIQTPTKLTKEQRKLFEQLAELEGTSLRPKSGRKAKGVRAKMSDWVKRVGQAVREWATGVVGVVSTPKAAKKLL
ncbi:MAG: molecular chaperone DnaJ [Blastocatellia bacterium]|nr:molecular chaperone DnaJ [Blastocatellia bacterium]